MIYFKDKNCVCRQAIDYYEQKGLVTNNLRKAKVVVMWSDIPPTENTICETAKEMGIPVIIIAHGRNCTTNYDPDYMDIFTGQKAYKFQGDKFLVWGKDDVERLKKGGVPDNKITIIGCPLIPCALPERINKKAVIFLTHHDHSRKDARDANEKIHTVLVNKYGKEILTYMIGEDIKKISKYIMIVGPQMDNEDIIKPIDNNSFGILRIDSEDRVAWMNIISALMHAKVMVSCTGGSLEGLAMAMDIPVVRVDIDFGYRNSDGSKYTDDTLGVELTSLDNLINSIENINPNKFKEERKKVAIKEMGVNYLPALPNIIKEIDKCLYDI